MQRVEKSQRCLLEQNIGIDISQCRFEDMQIFQSVRVDREQRFEYLRASWEEGLPVIIFSVIDGEQPRAELHQRPLILRYPEAVMRGVGGHGLRNPAIGSGSYCNVYRGGEVDRLHRVIWIDADAGDRSTPSEARILLNQRLISQTIVPTPHPWFTSGLFSKSSHSTNYPNCTGQLSHNQTAKARSLLQQLSIVQATLGHRW